LATVEIRRVLTFGADAERVLGAWEQPDVERRVLAHLLQLTGTDPGVVVDPAERRGDGCRWSVRTDQGSVAGTLAVRPAPNDLGTEVTLAVHSDDSVPLPDAITSAAVFEALHRFKSLVETGEIPTLDRNPHARHSGPDPH
jgi:hypothetical protein